MHDEENSAKNIPLLCHIHKRLFVYAVLIATKSVLKKRKCSTIFTPSHGAHIVCAHRNVCAFTTTRSQKSIPLQVVINRKVSIKLKIILFIFIIENRIKRINMFFAVILFDKTKLCIPAGWLQNIDIVRCFNNAHKRYEKKVIFYSSNEHRSPDFLLPIRNKFDENTDACYNAYVVKAFHSKESCIDHLHKRRAVIPPVYFPTRDASVNNLNAEIDRQMAIDQKVMIKQEVESLRQALLNNNRTIHSVDLTESDTEDFQNGLHENITVEEELNTFNEVSSNESGLADVLSGNIPFEQDDTVTR